MMRFELSLLAFALLVTMGCAESEPDHDLVELDLLSHGVPIVIKAPEGAVVEKMDLIVQQDITVKGDEGFSLQIFESDANTNDISLIVDRMMREVKRNPYFSEIVSEDDRGFIYKTAIDTNYVNYGFRHVRVQGDKEYVFQTAMRGKFSLEEVERMKAAVE